MFNNLVIGTITLALVQQTNAPPLKPITDPDAYAIYAALLPSIWKRSGRRADPPGPGNDNRIVPCVAPRGVGWSPEGLRQTKHERLDVTARSAPR